MKIKSLQEIRKIAESLRCRGEKIVTTNGVFDIIHVGHARYLQKAKSLGDVLIIGLNSDSSVRMIKGPMRPINDEKSRAEVLAALECVDYIVIFDDTDPVRLLSEIKPDIHVKGGDYRIGEIIERGAVEKNNGKVVLMPMEKGYSTTGLIKKIVDAYRE